MFRIIISITAIMISIVIIQLANGMVGPTIMLNANSAGASLSSVGMIPTIYGLGFVLGCFWARKLLNTIGHIRSFTVAAAMLAALTLMMHLISDTFAWIVFRGIMGASIAIIMTCIDSWVGHVTPNEMRGRVIGFYSTMIKFAYVGAPALLSYSILISERAIIFAVLLFIISLIPVCMTKLPQPTIGPVTTTSFKALLKDVPSSFVAVFVLGLTNSAVLNLLPVYGVKIGFNVSQALTLLMMAHLGGLLFQWPLGYLSDIFTRRKIMSTSFLISAAAAVGMSFSDSTTNSMILSFIWGGAALSVYSVSLAHAIDHVKSEETVAVCATMLTTWSIGSIFGPMIAGILMGSTSVYALYIFCAVCHGIAGILILIRLMTTARRIRMEIKLNQISTEDASWPQQRPLS